VLGVERRAGLGHPPAPISRCLRARRLDHVVHCAAGPDMIPLSDENPTLHTPWMTWLLIGTTVAVWMTVQGAGIGDKLPISVCNLGLVPGELTHQAPVGLTVPIGGGLGCSIDQHPINRFTPLLSMFLHGSWGHLLGNMLFFWVFGNNIEDSMGPGRFLIFYLLCGLVAAGAHVFVDPASPVPTVGASGAISGVMGAYLVLYPRVRVNMLFIFIIFFKVIAIPAWLVLLWWFALQVLTGLPQLTPMRPEVSGGVAVWAHVGGFVAGVILIKLFENPRLVAKRDEIREIEHPHRHYDLPRL
jgi:membrane associated rhomboid family serine protease